ncbi:M20/M25/M40 family metallo-hydrolase, partial [Staphylococcus aureus]|nr:M20/M25/M40 family metallo-hydrolase [Staphylococcus aureus]
GSGSPILAMSGHMDVVDAGNHEKWTYPPFELTEQDGKLYGRGTTDMKGALMGMVITLIELKMSDALPKGTIRLLATTGEEKEQAGAKLFAKAGYLDDLDGLIIGEPTDNGVFYAHKGSMACKVTATGVAAHSSMPFLGDNAINTLV